MHHSSALFLSLLIVMPAWAQSVPSLMNYQGRLTDEASRPLSNGTYAVQFRLWNRATTNQPGETLVWGHQYDLTIINGVFSVILGAPGGTPLPGTAVNDLKFAFGDAERYLGLTLVRLHDGTVISESQRKEILPRQQLLSTPYALMAGGLVKELADALCPSGTVIAWMGTDSVPPAGWEFCWGQVVGRTDPKYARLFGVIGTSSGIGNGPTSFNLPDLRAMFLRGVNADRVDSYQDAAALARSSFAGGFPGNQVGSVQMDAIQDHTHSYYYGVVGTGPELNVSGGPAVNIRATTQSSAPNGARVSAGVNSETRPKNVYVHYLIKL